MARTVSLFDKLFAEYDTSHEHVASPFGQNILKHYFFDNLYVTNYNDFRSQYTKLTKSDCDICITRAIEVCDWSLFDSIENPSENVMLAYVKRFKNYSSCHIKSPTKKIIRYMINESLYYEYKEEHALMFDHDELKEIVYKCPTFMSVNQNQTIELCKIALENANSFHQIKNINDEVVDIIFNNNNAKLLDHIDKIPKEFLTQTRLKIGFEKHTICIKYMYPLTQEICNIAFERDPRMIEFIPKVYQKTHMIKRIMTDRNYQSHAKYLHNLTEEMCCELIDQNVWNINHIPINFHNKKLCSDVIKKKHNLLDKCHYIDKEMLNIIFKSEILKNIPKKARLAFINDYDEESLERIVSASPCIIQHLQRKKQTSIIIKSALSLDGYTLQYVHDKTPELIEIALNNQPLAKKYI